MVAPRPAGFWIRAAAAIVDFVVISVAGNSFVAIARIVNGVAERDPWAPPVVFFTMIFAAAYTTVLHAATGQTIGKLLMGVRALGGPGVPPSAGQALLRHIGYGISLVPLGLGFVMAGLRRDRRALHDLLAGTRVVRARDDTPSGADTSPPAADSEELVPPIG